MSPLATTLKNLMWSFPYMMDDHSEAYAILDRACKNLVDL